MIQGKFAGIAIGGLAGYLLLSKGLNVISSCVSNICEERKWKNYYKYGKDGNMVAPGYSSHTHQIDDKTEMVVEDDSQKAASQKPSDTPIGASIAKVVDAALDKLKEKEKASEEQTEASSDDAEHGNDTDGDEVVTFPVSEKCEPKADIPTVEEDEE